MSTLKQTFESLLQNLNPAIYDYSVAPDPNNPTDPGDFARLWKLSESNKRILILWPKTAPDETVSPVNTTPVVSPIELAVCLASKAADSPETWPQIAIIDLNPKANCSAPLYRYFCSLRPDRIPWLKVFQADDLLAASPASADCLEKVLFPDIPSLVPNNTDDELRNRVIATYKQLRRQMRLNVSEEGSEAEFNRHNLANIIGPMILRGGKLPTSEILIQGGETIALASPHASALSSVLESCALLSPPKSGTPADASSGTGLDLLLVDDQAHHGWEAWIRETLPGANLKTLPSPHALLALLKAQFQINSKGDASNDLRFRLTLPEFAANQNPILLLDLRLFGGNWDAELRFYDELFPFVEQHFCRSDLAWEGIDQELIDGLKTWRNNSAKTDSAGHIQALTLLPRVLALADPSLPILLFSSTGKREITDILTDYGNIILEFEKPRFFAGRITVQPDDVAAAFGHAVQTACWWRNVREYVSAINSRAIPNLENARENFSGMTHFEVFHDEAGVDTQFRFRLAALIAGFQQSTDSDLLDHAIVGRRLTFYGNPAPLKKLFTPPDSIEKQWRTQIAAPLTSVVAGRCALLPSVVISGLTPRAAKDDYSMMEPTSLDNLNWDLLSLLAEILLIDLIPWLSDSPDLSIHFYGGTRNRVIPLRARTEREAENEQDIHDKELRLRWGISGEGGPRASLINPKPDGTWEYTWSSLGYDGFHSFVSSAIFQRQQSVHGTRVGEAISRALGVGLAYKSNSPYQPFRHLHYFADRIASLSGLNVRTGKVELGEIANHPPFYNVPSGFLGLRDPDLLSILNCNRCLDVGEVPEAFCLFQNIEGGSDVATDIVVKRLQNAIPHMTGSDIRRLVGLLKSPPSWMEINRLRAQNRTPSSAAKNSDLPTSVAPTSQIESSPAISGKTAEIPASEEPRRNGMLLSRTRLRVFGFMPTHTNDVQSRIVKWLKEKGDQIKVINKYPVDGVLILELSSARCYELDGESLDLPDGLQLQCQRAKASETERRRGETIRFSKSAGFDDSHA